MKSLPYIAAVANAVSLPPRRRGQVPTDTEPRIPTEGVTKSNILIREKAASVRKLNPQAGDFQLKQNNGDWSCARALGLRSRRPIGTGQACRCNFHTGRLSECHG